MGSVGTGWKEVIAADEAKRHADAVRAMTEMQRRKDQRFGAGRALHRKAVAAVHGRLRVLEGLPDYARHGLFASPGEHEVWVRLSNGAMDRQSNRRPDIRGFAMRVFGVDGDSALGGRTDHQDLSLINQTAFAFPDSRHFFGLVLAAGHGPTAVLAWVFRTFGLVGGVKQLKKLATTAGKPFTGFATEAFASTLPLSCGSAAVKVRLLPPTGLKPRADVNGDWAGDLAAHAAAAPLKYRLQLQFFVDEARTPVEDASVEWPESVAPFVDVAELLLAAPSAEAGFIAQIEAGVFDPWQSLAAHRPLGEVMRARKVAYFSSQQARGAA
ncbi:MAG: catalase [Burkholderiales bacterium]|nr:catalase [Burkholderiales bacterium]